MLSEGRPGLDDVYSIRDGTQKIIIITQWPFASS